MLNISNLVTEFDSVKALNGISFQAKPGCITTVIGANGAGKSTLLRTISGLERPTSGSIKWFDEELTHKSVEAIVRSGIAQVPEGHAVISQLSVAENIELGGLFRKRIARGDLEIATKEVYELFPILYERRNEPAGSLSGGERQRLAIARVLIKNAPVLILDEPTAVLTPQESESLFEVLAQMVAQGLSIIFISHKLGEVLRVSNRVAVLRCGKLVAEAQAQGTTQAQLAQWMVGHAIDAPVRRPAKSVGDAVCTLKQVSTGSGRERLARVSLTLNAGEIVAIAGVSGNGQVALAELLCGTRQATSGELTFLGQPMPRHPAELVALGVARIPEDRHAVGVVGDLPVWENAVSERLRSPAFSRWGWVRRARARLYAKQVMDAFDVRGGGPMVAARALSGGNMQKLILGRALMHPESAVATASQTSPRLIIAHQPTWGLDIGAVAYVQAQLIAARDAGAAVLVISDDLDEVLTLGDRVAVMHAGEMTTARPALSWSREAIGLAMAGVAAHSGGHP